uniref:alpha/beta fold hydrolase n=1 Tax=Herbidospora sakaeratensis TaxID=564415 RepID=UPI0007832D7C|nr:alpha/beta hydrolase [Herbidospora sakaeratensis]
MAELTEAGLTMPVLVIAGDRDALIKGPETARRMRANVPEADVRLLPGVGHLIAGQTAIVADFLAGGVGSGRSSS